MQTASNRPLRPQIAWLLLAFVVLLGAILRFQAIASTVVDHPIRADAQLYYFCALNLERWGVFSKQPPSEAAPAPDAFVPPALPFAISPLIEFPPTEQMLLRINTAQAILGSLTVLLAFLFFRSFASDKVSLGAAALTAISPHLVSMTTYMLTETLFTFFLVGGLCALAHAFRRDSSVWASIAGLVLGASALTRATTEYLPFFMAFILWFACERRQFIRLALPAVLGSLVFIVAWKLRNLSAIGGLSDPSLMMNAMHQGIYPNLMYNDLPESLGIAYRYDPRSAELASNSSALFEELSRRASAEPWRYISWYLFGKPMTLLSWNVVDGFGDIFVYPITASPYFNRPLFEITRSLIYYLHMPLTLLAMLGCLLTVTRPRLLSIPTETRLPALLVTLLIVYFFAVHMVGAPYPRYGIPLRPFVYGFGLFTFVRLSQAVLQARSQGLPT